MTRCGAQSHNASLKMSAKQMFANMARARKSRKPPGFNVARNLDKVNLISLKVDSNDVFGQAGGEYPTRVTSISYSYFGGCR
ncbi:hypothetical protein RRG08_010061 [Elysia crispata]|uniref:Uncharacterized protein n=1 Tax=Elysia crispata TaxID=231223 RepID=A0AAE1EBK5_9GAST|nr:hypothetical protein RRG08_010061 [Elysia crispata]